VQVHQIIDQSFGVNLYLVEAPHPVLIDTGTGRDTARVAALVEQILRGSRPEAILLTHRHFDHVGGTYDLSDRHRIPAYASPDEAPALLGGDALTTGAANWGLALAPIPVRILGYGEAFDLGDGELEAIHTPGHTAGHIVLLHRKTRSLFSGDCVFAHGNVGRWDLPTGDYDALVASLERLAKMDLANLYPGHGPYVEGDAKGHVALGLEMVRAWRP
jgi:glyoxylase-like metal-dependent hydrolase (beta-lactamase superfamily II)